MGTWTPPSPPDGPGACAAGRAVPGGDTVAVVSPRPCPTSHGAGPAVLGSGSQCLLREENPPGAERGSPSAVVIFSTRCQRCRIALVPSGLKTAGLTGEGTAAQRPARNAHPLHASLKPPQLKKIHFLLHLLLSCCFKGFISLTLTRIPVGLWQPAGLGWISWKRRFFSGVGTWTVKGAGVSVPPSPARAHWVPWGSPTSSMTRVWSKRCIPARIRSRLFLILAPTSTIPVPRFCPTASLLLPALLGPTAGIGLVPTPAAKVCCVFLERGHFPGICGGNEPLEVGVQPWWHLSNGSACAGGGRGASRQEFPAEFPPLQVW